jgi:hypothetical protein
MMDTPGTAEDSGGQRRRWPLTAAVMTGVVLGLLVAAYWDWARERPLVCDPATDVAMCFEFRDVAELFAAAVVLVVLVLGVLSCWAFGRGMPFPVAMAVGGLGLFTAGSLLRAWEASVPGTPRPPLWVLAGIGVAGYTLATAVCTPRFPTWVRVLATVACVGIAVGWQVAALRAS